MHIICWRGAPIYFILRCSHCGKMHLHIWIVNTISAFSYDFAFEVHMDNKHGAHSPGVYSHKSTAKKTHDSRGFVTGLLATDPCATHPDPAIPTIWITSSGWGATATSPTTAHGSPRTSSSIFSRTADLETWPMSSGNRVSRMHRDC